MSVVSPNFGHAPAGAKSQNTHAIGVDTLVFAPGTAITTQSLYDATASTRRPYRTSILQTLAQQRGVVITSLMANHNLELAATEVGASASKDLEIFLRYSSIRITVLGKAEDDIPLEHLLPYHMINFNGTVSLVQKQSPLFVFPDPIEVPAGGDIKIEFVPLAGYSTAAAAATNPHFPGAGLTSDRGYGLTLTYFGAQIRPIA